MRVSLALFVYWVVGFVVAMTQNWPAELDTEPSDDPETLVQWIVRGSLLAPPLAPLVVQVMATSLAALRRTGWALVGVVALLLLGAVYTIATFGEPFEPARSDPPTAVYLAFRVLGISLLAALIGCAVWAILEWIRNRRRREPRHR